MPEISLKNFLFPIFLFFSMKLPAVFSNYFSLEKNV